MLQVKSNRVFYFASFWMLKTELIVKILGFHYFRKTKMHLVLGVRWKDFILSKMGFPGSYYVLKTVIEFH